MGLWKSASSLQIWPTASSLGTQTCAAIATAARLLWAGLLLGLGVPAAAVMVGVRERERDGRVRGAAMDWSMRADGEPH